MRIPVTINLNTLKTYNNYDNRRKVVNKLQSDNLFDWDKEIPKSLQEICLEAIAQNWEENPLLNEIPLTINRCILLNILSTQLPLILTVPKINDDIYWKRCYLEKWPKAIPENVPLDFQIIEIVKVSNSRKDSVTSTSLPSRRPSEEYRRTWKECFLESYIRDYLEKLKPEDYDAEKIKELSDLCGNYVRILRIRELQASENSSSRIPLNAILTGLVNLKELELCFKQTYVGEKFTWNVLKVPFLDIKLLAKGLEKCHLKVFRLVNSDIDDEKCIIILKSLLKHDELQTLDFSHCRISNNSAIALSNFCLQSPVSELILANNKIGSEGIEALCYAISKSSCNLKMLDLKLNPIGNKGAEFLMKPLTMGVRNLKKVFLNGCGIKSLSSLGEMIEHNSCLEYLNLCNNSLGEEMGKIILQGLRYNRTLTNLDLRMCKLHPEDEFEILQRINKNKAAKRCPRTVKKPIIIEPQYSLEISEELLSKIENVFEGIEISAVETIKSVEILEETEESTETHNH